MFSTEFGEDYPSVASLSADVVSLLQSVPSVNEVKLVQFFLGPPGSGAPLHWHDAALNFLAFGEKEWFLAPPTSPAASYSNAPVLQWLDHPSVNPDDFVRCTQRPGDVVYVPHQWAHATLNSKVAIGKAHT